MAGWERVEVRVEPLTSAVLGACAADTSDRPRFFLATATRLVGVDFDDGSVFFDVALPFSFAERERNQPSSAVLSASADGRYVAVADAFGVEGAVFDTQTGRALQPLLRADYHAAVSCWALAIVQHDGAPVLITATAWNRLEALSLPSLERLAPSSDESNLDYFFGRAVASPSGAKLATFGWHWHPIGSLTVIDVRAWLETKSDPPPMTSLVTAEWWDDEVFWLDDERLIVSGAFDEDGYAERPGGDSCVDVRTASRSPVPVMPSRSDELAFATRTLPSRATHWHAGAHVALTVPEEAGSPFVVQWLTGHLATRVHLPSLVDADALLVLADQLEELGAPAEWVEHLRARGPHGRRCWVVEGLLRA